MGSAAPGRWLAVAVILAVVIGIGIGYWLFNAL